MEPLTINDVKDYLGINWEDVTLERRITRLLQVADSLLTGAIGKDYVKNDPRAQELTLMIVADLFDNRDLTQKEKSTYRKIAQDFELQMRLEKRK